MPSYWIHSKDGLTHKKYLPCMAVVYVEDGYYDITYGKNDPIRVTTGSVYIMPPYLPITLVHYVNPETNRFSCKWVYFNLLLGDTIDITKHLEMPYVLDPELSAIVGSKVLAILDRYPTVLRSFSEAVNRQADVFDILKDLLPLIKVNFDKNQSTLFLPALKYIDENLNSMISVNQLAALCNISTSYFYQRFKSVMGVTPNRYIIKKRLTKALELLMSTDEKLSSIAAETGFCDQFHLSHEFKKNYGQSPAEYKRATNYPKMQQPADDLYIINSGKEESE